VPKSQVDVVNLVSPDSPEIQKSLTIEGDYRVVTRFKELILIAGHGRHQTAPVVGNPANLVKLRS
jgi:hypothetical protein